MNWYKKLAIAAGATAALSATYIAGYKGGSSATSKRYEAQLNNLATQVFTSAVTLQQRSNSVNALSVDIARISSLEARLDSISSQFERSAEDGTFDLGAVEDYLNTRKELEASRQAFLRKTGKSTYRAESQSF